MPYIAIKAYPKDPAIQRRVAERIRQVFLEEWGCPNEAISVSMETVAPDDWERLVHRPEVLARPGIMLILDGQPPPP